MRGQSCPYGTSRIQVSMLAPTMYPLTSKLIRMNFPYSEKNNTFKHWPCHVLEILTREPTKLLLLMTQYSPLYTSIKNSEHSSPHFGSIRASSGSFLIGSGTFAVNHRSMNATLLKAGKMEGGREGGSRY